MMDELDNVRLDEEVVRGVAGNYENLDKEELVKFLYEIAELYDLELLAEMGAILDVE